MSPSLKILDAEQETPVGNGERVRFDASPGSVSDIFYPRPYKNYKSTGHLGIEGLPISKFNGLVFEASKVLNVKPYEILRRLRVGEEVEW